MALDADSLITVDEARDYLDEPLASVTALEAIISGVSGRILSAIDRQVLPDNAKTYTFRYDGQGFLDFDPYELRFFTFATLQSAGAGNLAAQLTLSVGVDLDLQPAQRTREGTYTWATMYARLEGRFGAAGSPAYVVAVTGDWGMAAVPRTLKLAALIATSNVYRNPEQFRTRTEAGITSSAESKSILPDASWDLMRPFLRSAA